MGLCMATTVGIHRTLEEDITGHEAELKDLEQALKDDQTLEVIWDKQRIKLCELWDQLETHTCQTGRR
ncbi:hypothetical protein NDU88_000814 [Pleurodeles waltl]|uniref:Uncharacterized protein n=1 Tax=Pleurodeles waltl TaxID=8319 RepID=A0AAV7MKT1_PLEWA|nr:hypothetical protein NDU88_000814 [Pleurodeles waltl]